MDTLLKSMMTLSRPGASEMDASPGVPLPESAADPSAAARFSKLMAQGLEMGNTGNAVTALQPPEALTESSRVEVPAPTTLGETLGSARVDQTEHKGTEQWLNTVTNIFEKDVISHVDLYRVQVLAGMAQIETTRNSSVNKSMDEGLKTLLKNT
ncbi:MAG: hypothetical protein JEZ12_25610 [Desulfobacterium sp.]|nr:hypothetical protein [Desulfobacterium sp.]